MPDWAREPLQPFAHIDETTSGFTELRVHGVSGPPADHVLNYPAEVVTLVQGNATSGFWRRWRLGGNLEDVPSRHRIEAFSWGGLTSRAALQALWLLLLPFSLVNLAHWMLPPYAGGRLDRAVSYIAVSLLRVLGLSFTVTLALAGAEVTMDLGAWQCGGNAGCLGVLQRHDPLGRFLAGPGPRVAVGGALLSLVLLALLLAGNSRFLPLRDDDALNGAVVPLARDQPVLGEPQFWKADDSTRWLRCLHTIAWCAATGAVATGALAAVRPQGDHNPVGIALACANLAVLLGVALLVFLQYFGRGGRGPKRTTGYRWVNLAAVCLLAASLTVTAVYMPATPPGDRPALPYVQGGLGWLTFGQAVTLVVLAGCVGWLAWHFNHDGAVRAARGDDRGHPWGPLLGGMATVVVAALGWLLGLAQSAGYGRWVADRLRGGTAPGGDFQAVLPNFYTWIDAYAVLVIAIILIWAVYLACRVWHRTNDARQEVLRAAQPDDPGGEDEPGSEERPAPETVSDEQRSRATAAARWRILAQSVETVPLVIAMAVVAGLVFLVPGWFVQFAAPGWIKAAASGGAWVVTAGTAGMVVVAYAAFRNQSTRRVVGILWDITTFWPRANHPLTPPCSAQRAVPQLAERIAALTSGANDDLVLSAHSQGSVLAAAAVLRLAHDEEDTCLARVSLLTYGSPLRRLYARSFPAYFAPPVLRVVWDKTGKRWINLWAQTDPIGAAIALPPARVRDKSPEARIDWQMLPDPLTLDADPRTGQPVSVCDHSGYLGRPEYPAAVESLRRLPAGDKYELARADGEIVDGSRQYVLRLTAGQLPRAGAAWSVTLYGPRGEPFRNALMRFSLGSAGERLTRDLGGNADIYIQALPPPAAQWPNWLPAPKGRFKVVLRVDWRTGRKPEAWQPPVLDVS